MTITSYRRFIEHLKNQLTVITFLKQTVIEFEHYLVYKNKSTAESALIARKYNQLFLWLYYCGLKVGCKLLNGTHEKGGKSSRFNG